MPRTLEEIQAHAEQLSKQLEDHETTEQDHARASALAELHRAVIARD